MRYVKIYNTPVFDQCVQILCLSLTNYFASDDKITKFSFYIMFVVNLTGFSNVLDSENSYDMAKNVILI